MTKKDKNLLFLTFCNNSRDTMKIDRLIEKLEDKLENTKSHQKKVELISNIEELKQKKENMEPWETSQIDADKYL